jgi:hypothetical protein
MAITLPPAIRAYYTAEQGSDFKALAHCFTPEGVVRDEGREIEGRAAIATWMAEAKAKYGHRTEIVSAREADQGWAVRVRVSGSFPNSPVTLEQSFRLADGLIAVLEIH